MSPRRIPLYRWLFLALVAAVSLLASLPGRALGGSGVSFWSGGPASSCEPCDDDDAESKLTALALLAGGVAVTSPWWGPPVVLEDNYSLLGRFPRHPYDEGHNGFLVEDADTHASSLRTGDFFVRAHADWGSDFDGVQRLGTNLHIETRRRWGFDAEWARYFEEDRGLTDRDHQMGDGNVILRFAQSKHAQWWTGGGFNWFDELGETDFGYNFTYGADVYLGDPWVLSAQFDLGEIERQGFFRGRIQIGATWRGIEAFTGFDYLDYRDHHDGLLVAGLRGWF